jgi:RHS repeat-associated protein
VQKQFFRFICLFLLLFQFAVSANSSSSCDHLGTPKELYNAQGECVWQAQHSLWGKLSLVKSKSYNPTQAVIEQNAGSNDYKEDLDFQLPNHSCELRFAGQWFDAESGLHYNYNRYYDPNSGQYLSQDPIGLAGGMRTQAYVADPVHWVDPLGLAPCLALPAPKNSDPWMPGTPLTAFRVPKGGMEIDMAMSPGQPRPGAWGTTDHIPNVKYVREDLAVIPAFKKNVSHVQRFRIPEGTPVQVGTVGPQTQNGVVYRGGGNQVQILNPRSTTLEPIGAPRPIE